MYMKKLIFLFLALLSFQIGASQNRDWLQSLKVAQVLARSENKLILMVWEQSTEIPFPAIVKDTNGKKIFINNLFESTEITDIFWDYFIPVKVDEDVYPTLFESIKDKRKRSYIDDFNDESLKVMDANANIIGTSGADTEILDISKFITKYSLNMSYVSQNLINYNKKKDFYSTFYLGSKYIDYSILVNKEVRKGILNLSNIYFDKAEILLQSEVGLKDKQGLAQRIFLIKLKQELIKGKPRKVLRELKKKEEETLFDVNKPLKVFLLYTAYRLLNNVDQFSVLEKDLSLLNKKLAQLIVDINR